MPLVPAFCDTCGTVFSSGMFFENCVGITLSGNRAGPCPECGGMGHVSDGVFNFIGDTIEILSAPGRTIHELTKLAEILRNAKAKSQSKEEVAAKIDKEVPGLSLIAKLLPENKSELYGFLSVALTVITLCSEPSQPSTSNITVNVTQVIEQVVQQEKRPKPNIVIPMKKKVGRNEPCICNSGKKFKKCCGTIQ
ncbi:MAG: SEC-C metal-binding domain-containing protein [Methylobacter sp.]